MKTVNFLKKCTYVGEKLIIKSKEKFTQHRMDFLKNIKNQKKIIRNLNNEKHK